MTVTPVDQATTATHAGVKAAFDKALDTAQTSDPTLTADQMAAFENAAVSVMEPLLMNQLSDILGDAMSGGES